MSLEGGLDLGIVLRDVGTLVVENIDIVLSSCIFLVGSLVLPLHCLDIVLRDTKTDILKVIYFALAVSIPLLGRLAAPVHGCLAVLMDFSTFPVHVTKSNLGLCVSLNGADHDLSEIAGASGS